MANDFTRNPGGAGGRPAAPRSFINVQRPQPTAKYDRDEKSAAPATRDGTAATSKQANPSADPGNPIGVGSIGNSSVPFRLGGG